LQGFAAGREAWEYFRLKSAQGAFLKVFSSNLGSLLHFCAHPQKAAGKPLPGQSFLTPGKSPPAFPQILPSAVALSAETAWSLRSTRPITVTG
jgi:hypothetical protein